MAVANAVAVTTVAIYVVCALAIVLFPDLSIGIAQSWFHGIDITQLQAFNVTPGSFVYGLVTATIGAWAVGYFYAFVFNMFLGKKGR